MYKYLGNVPSILHSYQLNTIHSHRSHQSTKKIQHTMGYTALVTGANRGIGLGIVEQLAANPDVEIVFAAARNPTASALTNLVQTYGAKVRSIALEIVDEQS